MHPQRITPLLPLQRNAPGRKQRRAAHSPLKPSIPSRLKISLRYLPASPPLLAGTPATIRTTSYDLSTSITNAPPSRQASQIPASSTDTHASTARGIIVPSPPIPPSPDVPPAQAFRLDRESLASPLPAHPLRITNAPATPFPPLAPSPISQKSRVPRFPFKHRSQTRLQKLEKESPQNHV